MSQLPEFPLMWLMVIVALSCLISSYRPVWLPVNRAFSWNIYLGFNLRGYSPVLGWSLANSALVARLTMGFLKPNDHSSGFLTPLPKLGVTF